MARGRADWGTGGRAGGAMERSGDDDRDHGFQGYGTHNFGAQDHECANDEGAVSGNDGAAAPYRGSGAVMAAPEGPGRAVRVLRALSGSVVAGLVLLTIGIIVVSILGGRRGIPGPGDESLIVHLVASAVALLAQRYADRRRGLAAAASLLVVFCVAGAVLWTQWWG
ncbi:hypothetical protein [Tomitella cavernea]|uniref:Uncharacterized protein n=1 Tax=Tomitella cavernea TaxID=1387982 RepID=A0ABP9CK30_9ACTN|nr:hypothetical protein [Tomitella cavernea]